MAPGSTANLTAKANGDSSMLHESEKTWKAFTNLSRKTRVIW
jgi:hypothetical protein